MGEAILSIFSGVLTEVIVGIILALFAGGGTYVWGRRKYQQGKKEAENERRKETLESFEAGQDAKRNRPVDPDDAVRRNDGKW